MISQHRLVIRPLLITTLLLAGIILTTTVPAAAQAQDQKQAPDIIDITIRNLSNTVESSVDPLLLADKTGIVHLFWSEDVGGRLSIGGTTGGNTIMYSRWDGVSWSTPVDILLSPLDTADASFGDPKAYAPAGVIDDQGVIHLIWLGQYPEKLYYSYAHAAEAGSASSWSTPVALIDDSTGSEYSADIKYIAPQTFYIAYARVHWETQYVDDQPRSLAYIRSQDGGQTWSDPQDISVVPDPDRGYSNVRLTQAPGTRLFVSWTEWDSSGNGQAVYVARSLDNGDSWTQPIKLAERAPIDYERDFLQLAWLEGDRFVAVWEGGFRAYRQFMYSDDNGLTWSKAEDRFYWLIGDNGFPIFVRDSADNLHFFVAQRIREGSIGRSGTLGLWHSVWLGGTKWMDAELVGGGNDMVFIAAVVVNGNQLVVAWYATLQGEVMVMNATVEGVPTIPPEPWPTVNTEAQEVEATIVPLQTTQIPSITTQTTIPNDLAQIASGSTVNVGSPIFIAMVPTLLIIIVIGLIRFRILHRRN